MMIPKAELEVAEPFEPNMMEKMMTHNSADGATKQFADDRMLGVYAIRQDGADGFTNKENRIDLSGMVTEEGVTFQVPEGNWKIYVTQLTRNRGPHRDYINMMDKASCKCRSRRCMSLTGRITKRNSEGRSPDFSRMSRNLGTDISTIRITDWDALRQWTIRGAGNWKRG